MPDFIDEKKLKKHLKRWNVPEKEIEQFIQDLKDDVEEIVEDTFDKDLDLDEYLK